MLPFREHGTGNADPVFVLLHHFSGSHREWEQPIALLQNEHRLLAADMAGFGEASTLEGFSVAEMEGRVRQLVDYLAPARVVLVGHSMSGKAAMVLAATPPANLAGMVLLAPSPLAGEPMTDGARAEMRIANTSRDRAENFIRQGFASRPGEQTLEVAVEDVLRSSDAAMHAWADAGTREDWSDRVKRLGVKTLLVVGDADKAIDSSLQMEQTLPLVTATGGRMVPLPDCAHLIPYEQPRELAKILREFATEVQ